MSTLNRSMSLIERKRLQWAKEREELASLCAPWGPPDQNTEKSAGRYAAKVSMLHNDYLRKDYKENRRSSLPPLYKNQYNSYDYREKELGGETSGYGSDNPHHTPECNPNWHNSGYESSSSRDDRPKWGDKGVGVGKFWQAKEETFETNKANEPPNWVKRGLQDGEIVVSNTSPAESPEQRYEETERPGSSYSQQQRTYVRGQNIRLDSIELAERERKRQIALAHQEAIRQQLEERERKRREERERRLQEEREEELRIEREQELERQRKENELRMFREKQERERKRKEAIQEAMELAQKEAVLEKSKRINRQANSNNNISNVIETDKFSNINTNAGTTKSYSIDHDNKVEESKNPEQLNNTRIITAKAEPLNNEINNNLDFKDNNCRSPVSPKEKPAESKPLPPILPPRETFNDIHSANNSSNTINNVSATPLFTPRTENLALVIQTPLEGLQNLQYALLVPATPQNVPIAVPVNVPQVDRSSNTSRTENRLLTPTQYRNRNKRLCDSSTQTDDFDFGRTSATDIKEKFIREKLTNLELSYENRNRREKRSRSESLEERPKWGANRPPTRYLKQSEKDPLYQRRKMRQKMGGCKSYDEKNTSDDESQTATTPRSYRKKSYMENRHARALWRNNDHIFTRNIRLYQTEIIPLESDRDQIYYKTHDCCCICKCEKRKNSTENVQVDILKIERTSPRESIPYKTELLNSSENGQDGTNRDILEKLSSLQNGLLKKQEQWETCPSSPSLSSAHRS